MDQPWQGACERDGDGAAYAPDQAEGNVKPQRIWMTMFAAW
jgi:hypothetical protein